MDESIVRTRVEALDALLGFRFAVLSDGFVSVVDYMGSDDSIVRAARVSYGKGTTRVREDRALIRYLMRHHHTTPFEMCEITLHVRVPMDAWRQWIRHRTANVNEYSTRYSEAIDAAETTDPSKWRAQSTTNKQGSGGFLPLDQGILLSSQEARVQSEMREVYKSRLEAGVAREQARKDLPLSTYTEAYWKIDLHNLFHFLQLRMDSHAQVEIRSYADVIGKSIVSWWCPVAWDAFVDYRLNALQLTSLEVKIVSAIARGRLTFAVELAMEEGLIPPPGKAGAKIREREELEAKLRKLDLFIPWEPAT